MPAFRSRKTKGIVAESNTQYPKHLIERTREIGVMRAIGASDGSVLKIFMVEGLFMGVLSWLIGAILGLPISKLLSDTIGVAFLDAPLSYTFSTNGALLWLGSVLILAAMASFLPTWSPSRLTVREMLAYEYNRFGSDSPPLIQGAGVPDG